jgi:protein phosphatase
MVEASEQDRPVLAALHTDVGQARRVNQDFVAFREPGGPEEEARFGWLYILADGAGGMDDGDVASRYATEQMLEAYYQQPDLDWKERLRKALTQANTDLRALGASRNGGSRMATTMVATVIHDDQVDIANIGDSRAYHMRAGVLRQITRDQSLVAKLVEEGAITPEEAEVHPRRHVLLHSIGSDRNPQIDFYHLYLQRDDVLLLCSDGLIRHVQDAEIASTLVAEPEPDQAARILIDLANERGGQDNISVVILRFTPRAVAETQLATQREPAGQIARRALWIYTAFLSVVQTILIFLVWYLLQV